MSDDVDAPPPTKPETPLERRDTEWPERPERPERSERPERPERPERDEPDRLTETIRQRLEQLVPDLVKKTFAAGMGAVFTTEEGIRRVVGGARDSLPEVAGYLASSADGAKDRVFEVIARETRDFLSNLNLTDEIAKILTTLSFEIKTEIRFIPNSERYTGVDPDVKAQVRLKRSDRPDKGDKAERDGEGDPDSTKDDTGRLRRLWRRATGNGNGTDTDERDDDDDGGPSENE